MADDGEGEPKQGSTGAPAPADAGERAGDFERYALIAALTLVVLCLLVWDRWNGRDSGTPAPRPDRTLHVEIGGGGAPTAPPDRPARVPGTDGPHVPGNAAPPAPPPPVQPPAPPPPRTYLVKDGDTLSEIARHELGSASRVQEIVDLNGIADASKIKIGQSLKLPAK